MLANHIVLETMHMVNGGNNYDYLDVREPHRSGNDVYRLETCLVSLRDLSVQARVNGGSN